MATASPARLGTRPRHDARPAGRRAMHRPPGRLLQPLVGLLALAGGARAAAQAPDASARESRVAGEASVRGVVFDSLLSLRPLAGAEVWVAGTGVSSRTDAAGRFRLDGLAPGRVEVAVSHPALDALGVAGPARAVTLAPGRVAELSLATPSATTLYAAACGGPPAPGLGLVLGVVRAGRGGAPAPGATVTAEWGTLVLGGGGAPASRVDRVAARTDAAGAYRLCGVPVDAPLAVRVVGADGALGVDALTLGDRAVARRDLLLPGTAGADRGGSRRVEGRVLTSAGTPVAGVRVRLAGADTSGPSGTSGATEVVATPTDSAGWFAVALPLGFVGGAPVQARALGYTPVPLPAGDSASAGGLAVTLRAVATAASEVEVRAADGTRLATVRVTAPRARAAMLEGYERRRRTLPGAYVTREQIEQRRAIGTAELFGLIPGMYVSMSGHVSVARTGAGPVKGECLPAFYIDGAKVHVPLGLIDPVITPQEIEGIEVYRGLGAVPPEYKGGDGGCGVILIWTRRG